MTQFSNIETLLKSITSSIQAVQAAIVAGIPSLPTPTSAAIGDYIRVAANGTSYELRTAAQTLADLGGQPLPAPATAGYFLDVNGGGTAYQLVSPAAVLSAIGAASTASISGFQDLPAPTVGTAAYFANINSAGSAYQVISPAAVLTAIGAQASGNYALAGANTDITSLSNLTTPLSAAQGGTGLSTVGTNGQYLGSNGTSILWVTPPRVIDNTSAATNLSMNVGDTAYISATTGTVTSLPLNIACSSGQLYTVDVVTQAAGSNGTFGLQPNDTTYSSAFAGTFSASYFEMVSANQPVLSSLRLSTQTTAKALWGTIACSASLATAAEHWNDTTTPWTSLGTLVWGVATQVELVVIRRLI